METENIILIDSLGLTTAEDIEAKQKQISKKKEDDKTVFFIGFNDIVFEKLEVVFRLRGFNLVRADVKDLDDKPSLVRDSRDTVRITNIAKAYAMQLGKSVVYEEELVDITSYPTDKKNIFTITRDTTDYEDKCKSIVKYLKGNPPAYRAISYSHYIGFCDYGKNQSYACNGVIRGEVSQLLRYSDSKITNYDSIFYMKKLGTTLSEIDEERKYQVSHFKASIDKFDAKLKTMYNN